MPLPNILKFFSRKRRSEKYNFIYEGDKRKAKKSFLNRFRKRRQTKASPMNPTIKDTDSVVSGWKIAELEAIICKMQAQNAEQRTVLSQQTSVMSMLRNKNLCLQQNLQILEQTRRDDPVYVNNTEDDHVGTQEKIPRYQTADGMLQDKIHELSRQKMLLENELAEIRETSRVVLSVHVNDCKGVAVGGVNDITLNNTDEDITEISAEVKRNLEAIMSRLEELSTACSRLNQHLSEQTV